jgi:hypothetical protein
MTPDVHFTIQYSLTLTSPFAINPDKLSLSPLFTAAHPAPPEVEFDGALYNSKDLILIAPGLPLSTTISPNTVCSLLLSVPCHHCSFFISGSRIDQNSWEPFGGCSYSPRAHLESFGSTPLIRYSYYIPCQY